MCKNESDPLLDKNLPAKTAKTVRKERRRQRRRNYKLASIAVVVLGMVTACMLVIRKASNISNSTPTSVVGRAKAAKAQVSIDKYGYYKVRPWDSQSITATTTFAELARIMLLPWYEASMMAILEDPAWESEDGITPANVKHIRTTLLMARSMLDVFSPVFVDTPDEAEKHHKKDADVRDRSLWRSLRLMYRVGYQTMGSLHDLVGITYSDQLYEDRVDAVYQWKKEFLAFVKLHEIRRFLYSDYSPGGVGGIDPNGKYYHESNHLFWFELDAELLPSGNDPGPASLRSLGSVQLEHSLNFLETIRDYETVMPRDHEIQFHNLRKEVRIFCDEYELFGSVLVPDDAGEEEEASDNDDEDDGDDDSDNDDYGDDDEYIPTETVPQKIHFLKIAQTKLGDINDAWTAHDLYIQDDASKKKIKSSAKLTDKLWKEFLVWQDQHDLEGVLNDVLERMNA